MTTVGILKWAIGAFAFLVTHEALFWSWTLARHACWMNKHSEFIICKNLNHRMVAIAATMAGALSMLMGVWFIWYRLYNAEYFFQSIAILISIQLSHIHFMALLARCTELPLSLWPLLSRYISTHVVSRVLHINTMVSIWYGRRYDDKRNRNKKENS